MKVYGIHCFVDSVIGVEVAEAKNLRDARTMMERNDSNLTCFSEEELRRIFEIIHKVQPGKITTI